MMAYSTILMWVAVGMLAALPFRPLMRRSEKQRTRLAAYGLIIAAGIYTVSGYMAGAMAVELGGLFIFGGIALIALGHWPVLAIFGWLTHTVWDFGAFLGLTGHALPGWYPPVCIGFDLAIAVMLLGAMRRTVRYSPA